ncbi:MAG: YceD family protein [Propionibacteriaceae bacterium]
MSTHRLTPDPRSGLVLSTHDVERRAGYMQEKTFSAPAPEGIGSDVIAVPEGSLIHLELRLESVSEGILVSGVADVELAGECARCLEALEDDLEVDIQELFVYPESEASDEEVSRIVDDLIDLEPLIRDQVVLDLPFTPLCDEDCLGLCPTCGANLNNSPEHSHQDQVDQRWAALTAWQSPADTQ